MNDAIDQGDKPPDPIGSDLASASTLGQPAAESLVPEPGRGVTLRRTPRQKRGAATFNSILDATARLLEQSGGESLSTNLIAKAAGVNVATLYQYFPSKEAILLALFQRYAEARIDLGRDAIAGLGENPQWPDQFSRVIDGIAALRLRQPGATALRRLMRSNAELQPYEQASMLAGARALGAELGKREGVAPAHADLAGLCVIELATSMIDLWSLGYADDLGFDNNALLTEYKKLATNYLAGYLGPDPVGR